MLMIKCRNRSSHTYNENTAREIAEAILGSFVAEFEKCLERMNRLKAEET